MLLIIGGDVHGNELGEFFSMSAEFEVQFQKMLGRWSTEENVKHFLRSCCNGKKSN